MSKATRQVIEEAKSGQSMGAMQAVIEGIREGVGAFAPGLSLSKILSDIGSEIRQSTAHGAHEAAAVLFNGSGFVMYPRSAGPQKEDPQQGLAEETIKPPELQQERGGLEM